MDKRVEYSAVDGGGKGEMKRYRIGRIEWQGNRGREEGREGLRDKEASTTDN